jgi:hypothetical protein
MAEACPAYSLAVHSSSADDVACLVLHPGHSLVTGVLVTFVDMSASVLVWVRLSKGFLQRGFVLRRSFADALERAHGGVVDTARSRSW